MSETATTVTAGSSASPRKFRMQRSPPCSPGWTTRRRGAWLRSPTAPRPVRPSRTRHVRLDTGIAHALGYAARYRTASGLATGGLGGTFRQPTPGLGGPIEANPWSVATDRSGTATDGLP